MITVVYCTRESNPEHTEHLIKTSGLHKHLEVIEIINNGESLTKAYNRGLKMATNKIVVFCHDDLTIETKQWGTKLIKLFERNKEYGIIGIAGTKFMAENGQWWTNPRKMYGRVQHTHEGKTWLSSYSDDLGQSLEETVIVDGLFFAVNKDVVKKEFNEDFEGFHFYDVSYCFDNFLEGVKVGVTTVVRVNHQSIGMVNEQWEENRKQFAETYKDKLPINIKKTLRKGEKLKIMVTSLSFDDANPKSKLILEFATKLKNEKHDVTICSNINGKIPSLAKKIGISLAPIQQPPGFALGDGKWVLNTNEGPVPSTPNTLYKVKDYKFDIIHTFDDELISHLEKLYGGSNIINTNFPNGLFINTEKNPLVKTTISLTNDLTEFVKLDIDNVIQEYIDVI
jgi:glycosyltransferase involved in cell wall biosynthesis